MYIKQDDRVLGVVVMLDDVSKGYSALRRKMILCLFLAGAIILIGACVFSIYIQKRIIDPFDRMEKFARNNNKILQEKSSNIIRIKQDDNEYKIYIDLKAFDNNENNVNIINENNTLTINGKSIKKSKNQEHILRFQQSYMFGDNVDLNNLKKETDGEYLVVSLPINKGNND